MGKLALDQISDYLAHQLAQTKEHRDILNQKAHLYTISGDSFYKELSTQLKSVKKYSSLKSADFDRKLRELANEYAVKILDSVRSYTGAKPVTIYPVVKGMPNSVLIVPNEGSNISVFDFIKNSNRKKKISELKTRLVDELFGSFTDTTSYKNFMRQSDVEYNAQLSNPTKRGAKKFTELNRTIFGTAVTEAGGSNYQRYANNKVNKKLNRVGQIIPQSGGIDIIHSEGDAVHKQRQAQALDNLLNDSISGIESIIGGLGSSISIQVTKETIRQKLNQLRAGFTSNIDIGFEITTLVEVSEGGAIFNRGLMAQAEKKELAALVPSIRRLIKNHDWAKQEGSDSPLSAIEKVIVNTTIDSLTKNSRSKLKKGKRLHINDKPDKGSSKVKPPTARRARNNGRQASIDTSAFKPKEEQRNPRTINKRTQNWSSILPLLNTRLPPTVIANMRYPSLVNRTGTFASSVKIVNVEQTKEGFPTFVYDYERNPYDVFDRTLGRSPWNTPERDPRALVDKSVRELVREMAIGRFYTRRA